jgi:hypothetical protein
LRTGDEEEGDEQVDAEEFVLSLFGRDGDELMRRA